MVLDQNPAVLLVKDTAAVTTDMLLKRSIEFRLLLDRGISHDKLLRRSRELRFTDPGNARDVPRIKISSDMGAQRNVD
jgi:hypothetical protein